MVCGHLANRLISELWKVADEPFGKDCIARAQVARLLQKAPNSADHWECERVLLEQGAFGRIFMSVHQRYAGRAP